MKKEYNIKVRLLSPMHINGGVSADGKRITVKSGNKPYIPATLLKGIVRNNFETLVNTFKTEKCIGKANSDSACKCMSCILFGKAGFQKSRVIFDNLESKQKLVTDIRANISINRYQRKANEGALVFSEVVSNFDFNGNDTFFEGKITAYYPERNIKEYDTFLKTAIKNINCIGLGKSRGLGFVEVEVK